MDNSWKLKYGTVAQWKSKSVKTAQATTTKELALKKKPTQTKEKTTNKKIKTPNCIKVTQRVGMAVADKV